MGANNIQRLDSQALVAFSNTMLATIGGGTSNPFGVTASQKSALTTAAGDLAIANAAVQAAKAAYHAAVQDRLTKDGSCASAAAAIARTVYANASLTPAQIASLGLSPRNTARTKVMPKTPATLTAALLPDGDVTLTWSRSGNAKTIVFRIEAQTGTGAWTFADETTATKMVLSGYPSSAATAFRVRATKNGLASAASPVATIYPATPASFLHVAA